MLYDYKLWIFKLHQRRFFFLCHDPFPVLVKYSIPIQLIWGRHDQTIPYADIESFTTEIPSAKLHTIEDAGHIPHFEHPEIVNPLLINFFSRPRP